MPIRVYEPTGADAEGAAVLFLHGGGFILGDLEHDQLELGGTVRLTVFIPDPRCVMTTLAQDDLPQDNDILRTLAQHNRLDVGDGLRPCAGVYAIVEATGSTQQGDRVALA